MGVINTLLRYRARPGARRLVREILYLYGCDIPPSVVIGEDVTFAHRGMGVVLHSRVEIGDGATIYHGVTVGRSSEGGGRTVIGSRAVLSVGCVVLSGPEGRTIGEGAIVGANAVVTSDVPPWEIWAGVPARKIGMRDEMGPSPW